MAVTYLEVQAAVAADARQGRALPEITGARQRGRRVLAEAEAALQASGLAAGVPTRLEADANLATARAFGARLEGNDDPVLWDAAAQAWERAGQPYEVARARWRQAEAALPSHDARVGRAAARGPLLQAVRIARELGARPLLRELTTLAGRGLINLPPDPAAAAPVPVGPGTPAMSPAAAAGGPSPAADQRVGVPVAGGRHDPAVAHGEPLAQRSRAGTRSDDADRPITRPAIAAAFAPEDRGRGAREAFGLSRREREVLMLIAEGRTNREIGERLFISQKTVGVHVGNILSKLGASGRVEAAMVAIRLELVPTPTAASMAAGASSPS
jgi:DNA-binding CsgD family transcriptional regulator